MSDPVGTLGRLPPVSDLQLALQGGDEFVVRMKELAAAKADAEMALQNLNLGKGIKQAHAEAKQNVAAAVQESNALSAQAKNTLADAQTQASNIVEDATAKADKIVADAQANAMAVKDEANKLKIGAEQYASDKMSTADALQAQATERLQSAQKASGDTEALAESHRIATAAAQQAKAQTEQLRADLQSRIDKLNGVLRGHNRRRTKRNYGVRWRAGCTLTT